MLLQPILRVLNYVLTEEGWARERLAVFRGKSVSVTTGFASLKISITDEGLLREADSTTVADVELVLLNDALLRQFSDRTSIFSAAKVSGSAELAETLAFVFRHLRWDIEHEVAHFTGDIVARRALQLIRSFGAWQSNAAKGLAIAVAEYLTDNERGLARRQQVERFCSDVDGFRDRLARFEKRLSQLEAARGYAVSCGYRSLSRQHVVVSALVSPE